MKTAILCYPRCHSFQQVKLLQSENDSLTNKRNIHSSIMNDEAFQIPNDMEVSLLYEALKNS